MRKLSARVLSCGGGLCPKSTIIGNPFCLLAIHMVPENQNLSRDLHVCVLQNQPHHMLDKDKKTTT